MHGHLPTQNKNRLQRQLQELLNIAIIISTLCHIHGPETIFNSEQRPSLTLRIHCRYQRTVRTIRVPSEDYKSKCKRQLPQIATARLLSWTKVTLSQSLCFSQNYWVMLKYTWEGYSVPQAHTPEEYILWATVAMSSQTFLDGFSFFVMVSPAGEWNKVQVYTGVTYTLVLWPLARFFSTSPQPNRYLSCLHMTYFTYGKLMILTLTTRNGACTKW